MGELSGDATDVRPGQCAHLSPAHTDDAVHIPIGIVKKGDGNGMLAGRDPVALGGRINLEHMSSRAEDWLLPEKEMTNNDSDR